MLWRREFKKQRCEGGADKCEEWALSKLKTQRENRVSSRGQKKREKRDAVKLTSRKAYLTKRVSELEAGASSLGGESRAYRAAFAKVPPGGGWGGD